jgi:hypothetical protein
MTKDELVRDLMLRVREPTDIGKVTGFIERAFKLQNDVGRPAYIFEADADMTSEDVNYLRQVMLELGVCCALVPPKTIDYVGKVTPKSMTEE